jgi:hypothetical protein
LGFFSQDHLDVGPRALGLVLNGMSEPKDRYALLKDASISAVREQHENAKGIAQQFRPGMLPEFDLYRLDFDEFVALHNTLYQPRAYPAPRVPLLWWLAEDKPARTPRYDEVKSEVLTAWQTMIAQKDARTYARELVEKDLKGRLWPGKDLKDRQGPGDVAVRTNEIEAFLKAQKKAGKVFVLENVARLWSPQTAPNLSFGPTYHAYAPPATDIEFPPTNLIDRLMTLQQTGDAVSFADRPEHNFYVAVLVERSAPTFDDFRKIYENAGDRIGHDPLWNYFVRDSRKAFTEQFIQRMREDATGELKEGKYNVDKEVRARYEKMDMAQ